MPSCAFVFADTCRRCGGEKSLSRLDAGNTFAYHLHRILQPRVGGGEVEEAPVEVPLATATTPATAGVHSSSLLITGVYMSGCLDGKRHLLPCHPAEADSLLWSQCEVVAAGKDFCYLFSPCDERETRRRERRRSTRSAGTARCRTPV